MTASTNMRLTPEVFETISPYIGNSELWCHRTLDNTASDFWTGLRIPSIQAGLRSTATRLTDKDEFPSLEAAIEEFTVRWIEENPMDNARVFVVVPDEQEHLLEPYNTGRSIDHIGLLPGRFVLAHVSLLDSVISINPSFNGGAS